MDGSVKRRKLKVLNEDRWESKKMRQNEKALNSD